MNAMYKVVIFSCCLLILSILQNADGFTVAVVTIPEGATDINTEIATLREKLNEKIKEALSGTKMVKVVMHPISLIVFLLFEVLMGAETAEMLSKTQNELASVHVNEKTILSDPKTLTNKSPPGEAAKTPLEASLIAAMASEDIKQDKPGASEVDPKLAKGVVEMKENLKYVKSENPEVPENATKSFVPVETESLPSLRMDHFVEKVTIPQVQKEKGVNSKDKKMEEVAVDSAATLDSGPFTTDNHSTSKSEVTTGQHSTTELEIEAAKTMISNSKTTKASPGVITGKIPTEGKGKMISSKLPRVETSIEGKNPQEACQKDRKMVKFESSQSNSALRSINNPLEYVILNLAMVVILLQLLNGLF
ncbi:hypothetical protein JTE90_027433 [Oedothorax gibbosus]|uniref:Uncharacterized protein n=1 Tax=Oedothorax gibbosus TaxID=931172 RepID=A0AAV6VZB1_9ARAC|nr:hypothetical protein JTE90_027433 [Oedothorax gibbosus]